MITVCYLLNLTECFRRLVSHLLSPLNRLRGMDNHCHRLFERIRSLTGQLTDFSGNHGKPPARFTGPCRLNGRIQREQIGLAGNFLNHQTDFGNFFHRVMDLLHGIQHALHITTALCCFFRRMFGKVFDLCGIFSVFPDGTLNLCHTPFQFFQKGILLQRALIELSRALRYAAGILMHFPRRPIHTDHRLIQCIRNMTERIMYGRKIAVECIGNLQCIISLCQYAQAVLYILYIAVETGNRFRQRLREDTCLVIAVASYHFLSEIPVGQCLQTPCCRRQRIGYLPGQLHNHRCRPQKQKHRQQNGHTNGKYHGTHIFPLRHLYQQCPVGTGNRRIPHIPVQMSHPHQGRSCLK